MEEDTGDGVDDHGGDTDGGDTHAGGVSIGDNDVGAVSGGGDMGGQDWNFSLESLTLVAVFDCGHGGDAGSVLDLNGVTFGKWRGGDCKARGWSFSTVAFTSSTNLLLIPSFNIHSSSTLPSTFRTINTFSSSP